MKNRVTKA